MERNTYSIPYIGGGQLVVNEESLLEYSEQLAVPPKGDHDGQQILLDLKTQAERVDLAKKVVFVPERFNNGE